MGAALCRGELPRNGEDDASWGGGLPDGGSSKGKGPEDASGAGAFGRAASLLTVFGAGCVPGADAGESQGPPRGDLAPLRPVSPQWRVLDTCKPAVFNSSQRAGLPVQRDVRVTAEGALGSTAGALGCVR